MAHLQIQSLPIYTFHWSIVWSECILTPSQTFNREFAFGPDFSALVSQRLNGPYLNCYTDQLLLLSTMPIRPI
ncbi:hypothetical protein FHW16_001991 [Phyllobacterium myrsinacearum]|uniref:Uncharacterized protein n=1 Tax=Phyllobacterium myrsinacearum TaxID=28101 RepID=A0A839EHL4_9HYPH|nr:hypothetical protein [Phyllobacterium myrsinacearum]